jgi:hypothetical protein
MRHGVSSCIFSSVTQQYVRFSIILAIVGRLAVVWWHCSDEFLEFWYIWGKVSSN